MSDDMFNTVEHEQLVQARQLISSNNLDDGLKILKRIIGKEPGNARAFNLLGAIYEKEGNLDVARRMYRAALALDPACRPAQANLGRLVQWPPELNAPDLAVSWPAEGPKAAEGGNTVCNNSRCLKRQLRFKNGAYDSQAAYQDK